MFGVGQTAFVYYRVQPHIRPNPNRAGVGKARAIGGVLKPQKHTHGGFEFMGLFGV